MGERAMNVTDYDVAPSAKPLPLEHQLGTTESGIASRNDSASGGKIGFMDQNNKLDAEYALPGGGANSNASWVRTLDLDFKSKALHHCHCPISAATYSYFKQAVLIQ